MGIIKFLRKITNSEPPIPKNEKKYYQPDSYYTKKTYEGTQFERDVITFEKRKKTSTVSRNGLYVAEILLLQYVSYGTYPHPKNGYPGFWWFEYGIRNIGAKLQSLEDRGFIRMSTPIENVGSLTVPELKEILKAYNMPIDGKKANLVQRITENLDDSDVKSYIPECKYRLTDLGEKELSENEYVPIMHKSPEKTTENAMFGPVFNVWEVNRRLAKNPDWQAVIEEMKQERASAEKHNRDVLWGKYNRESTQLFSDGNFGLYRNVRLDMALLLMKEKRYRSALMFFSEVVFWDLNCCGNNFNYETFLWLTFEFDGNSKNSLFPYEKSIMTIPKGIIRYIDNCKNELNISDTELRIFLLEDIQKYSAPIQIFEYEEMINIIFWERDNNINELKNVYQVAEKRFEMLGAKLLESN